MVVILVDSKEDMLTYSISVEKKVAQVREIVSERCCPSYQKQAGNSPTARML